jgi:hypothetical protein
MADLSRRKLLRGAVASAALIPLVHLDPRSAAAAEMVTPDDPTAKALNYVEDATQANRTDKAGTPAGEQMCSTCALYNGDGETAPCTLFQMRIVKGSGWCTAWVPKA